MWLLKYIISYSLSSILLGLLVAVILTLMFLLIAKQLNQSSSITPVSLATAFVLLLIIFVQSALFVGSKRISITVTDYEEHLNQIAATSNATVEEVMKQIREKAPVAWHFVSVNSYDMMPLTELPHAVCSGARSALNNYAWRRLWWAVGCFIVACAIVKLFENIGQKGYKTGRRKLTRSRTKFYDD